MNAQHLGGVVMGALVLLVGLAWVLGAIRRVRDRALTAPTYAATGGVVYTVFQIGCAGLLIVAGLVILILMAISASR
jgi:hypothetical protein